MPLPIIWKLLWLMGWPACLLYWWMGEGSFRCSLYLSPKVLEVSPIYSSSQERSPQWNPIYGSTFADHRVFVLGGDQLVPDGIITFEVGLYPIPPTDLFDTFMKTLCKRYDNVTLGFNFIGSRLGTWSVLVVSLIRKVLGGLIKPFSTLSKAHLGYLHWVSAFLRWVFPLQRSSGLLHTV